MGVSASEWECVYESVRAQRIRKSKREQRKWAKRQRIREKNVESCSQAKCLHLKSLEWFLAKQMLNWHRVDPAVWIVYKIVWSLKRLSTHTHTLTQYFGYITSDCHILADMTDVQNAIQVAHFVSLICSLIFLFSRFIYFYHDYYYHHRCEGEGISFCRTKCARPLNASTYTPSDSHFVAIFLMINIVLKYMSLSEHSVIRGKKQRQQ